LLSTPARKRHTQKTQISNTGVKSPPDMMRAAAPEAGCELEAALWTSASLRAWATDEPSNERGGGCAETDRALCSC
jgi:hypothetical protein